MKKIIILHTALVFWGANTFAQTGYWQQHVSYKMDINMDVRTNRFTGEQTLLYTNNSPDTLKKVFYHLYWNAFQPGSMMDKLSGEQMQQKTSLSLYKDQVADRIQHLKPDEIGYQKINSLTMNGVPQKYQVDETILEVFLTRSILPHTTVTFVMNFEAQVPLLIRRGGRDNPETGVRYSMSQWYPKICEYDKQGWHPTPYVLREFYGVWGKFDVKITIDKNYTLGGTGNLQEPGRIGHGYEKPGTKAEPTAGNKLTWHFTADTVHDFMWAADSGYHHIRRHLPGGPELHLLYVNHQRNPSIDTNWNDMADAVVEAYPFMQAHFGNYPYRQFSIIQGGDGGMEYPMAVLLSGANTSQAFHEMMHNWYYGMLGTNESLYAWMDEGFASYAQDLLWTRYLDRFVDRHPQNGRARSVRDYFRTLLPASHGEWYGNYFKLVKSGLEEPLSTHADHFATKVAYDIGDYAKGDIFLEQLGYIVGAATRDKILLQYYRTWRFKHPDPDDFFRVAEKVSGLQLDWYKQYWIYTTKTIDYGIDSVADAGGKTLVSLKMKGGMPMPLDILVNLKDGRKELYYIPLYLMFGGKGPENTIHRTVCTPWKWTDSSYTLQLPFQKKDIIDIEIDPSQRMADVNQEDNKLEVDK